MKLPNAAAARIGQEKLSGYLLSLEHPFGWPKALFFRRLGFHRGNARQMEDELLRIARDGDVVETMVTRFGTKYIVTGVLAAPDGRQVPLTTVWIVETGEAAPRFVTAYPGE